jgi:CubicO group peptidase (beta-lactamase class C family)
MLVKNSKIRVKQFVLIVLLAICLLGVQEYAAGKKTAKKIQQFVDCYFKQDKFTGTVLVAQGKDGKKIIYEGAFGMADREWKVKNDLDSKMMIGSNSKQFAALMIMQEVQKGRIKIKDTISDFLPWYRKDTGKQVTIQYLLSMQSGIPNYTTMPQYKNSQDIRLTFTTEEFINIYCSDDLDFPPGTDYAYSNSNYYILGGILEQITGKTYADLVQERIFIPLMMKDSGYNHHATVLPKRATGYNIENGVLTNGYFVDMSVPFAAGALYSTAGDINIWQASLYTDRLLDQKFREQMFVPRVSQQGLCAPLGFNCYYGYGFMIADLDNPANPVEKLLFIGHGGILPNGFKSFIGRIINDKYSIVVLSNTYTENGIDVPVLIFFGIVDILYGIQPQPPCACVSSD